jgi:hypothetical protein
MDSQFIKCVGIPYRQGWIEVATGIHEGYINLETWNITPDVDISPPSINLLHLEDGHVNGNTEIELSLELAKELVVTLKRAIEVVENGSV